MSYVPDYQGYFLRGLGGNSAAVGVYQGDAIRNISGTFGYLADDWGVTSSGPFWWQNTGGTSSFPHSTNGVQRYICFDASRSVPTAGEDRPVNKAVIYLIRAK